MSEATTEALFVRYRERGEAEALASVFDRLAPQLMLVAAHLAGGDVAEDLVQATFLDAIRQRDRWDATRPFAPWLVGLLGNHVRRARRARHRTPDVERLPTRPAELPEAMAEANECLAAVHAAVERLPQHYRQVLSLRLVHGFELHQIAHSLDVPLGTVKVRLHRGLGLLRRALPAGLTAAFAALLTPGRGLAAVRDVVLGHAGTVAGPVGAGAAVGVVGLLGGFVMKQVLVGAAVVTALVGGWFAVDAVIAARGPGAGDGPIAVPAVLPAEPPTPASQAGTTPTPASGPATQRTAAPTTGALELQVVWASDGAPACGVWVSPFARGQERVPSQRTDAQGRIGFRGLAPGAYRLLPHNVGVKVPVTAQVVAGEERSGRMEVDGDIRLRIAVVDADGTGQPGTEVWCFDPEDQGDRMRVVGVTQATGTLTYRGLPLGSLWARKPGHQPSLQFDPPGQHQATLPREPIDVRLVLGAAGCVVTGTVLDPHGRPVAAARVAVACDDAILSVAERHAELLLTADAAGRFRCDEVPPGERHIVAHAPGFAPAVARVTTVPTEPTPITLRLRVGASLSGQVRDAAGQPLAGTQVSARPARLLPGITIPFGTQPSVTTDAAGRYRLEALLPGELRATVAVQPEAVHQFTLADGEQQTWDVVKEPERQIVGVVVDAEGKPLHRWRVNVQGNSPDRSGHMGGRDASTDTAGRFRIAGLEDAPYRVFAFAPEAQGPTQSLAARMVPRAVVDAVRPSPSVVTVRIDAAAMASGWIEGTIAMPEGVRAKTELSLYAKVLQGGAFMVPQERLAPGVTTFRIGPLPAGEYDLLCDIEGRGRLAQRALYLAPGATLQLPPFAADAQRPVQLVLRHAGGRLASGANVKLKPTFTLCRETSPGTYESSPVSPGPCEAIVRGPDFAPCTFAFEFTGGAQPIERTVPKGTAVELRLQPATPRERWIGALQVWIKDAAGTEVVRDMIQIDGKSDFRWSIGLTPGTYSLRTVAFGDGSATASLEVGDSPLHVDLRMVK